jgi:hypothetical protein
MTIDAIGSGRFWVITHPGERAGVEARFSNVLAHFPPSGESNDTVIFNREK